MPQWEYIILWFDEHDWDKTTTRLNVRGTEGWELVGVLPPKTLFFKRPLPKTIPAMWDETKEQ